MLRLRYWFIALAAVICIPVGAQAQPYARTWVSGVGDDNNQCTRTAPCATWAGALAKTLPFGEIDALDPGGFGRVTITQSVSLIQDGSGVAGTAVSGANAIIINVPLGTVHLRGLTLNGENGSQSGILVEAAQAVSIENCLIEGFFTSGNYAGITISPTTIFSSSSVVIANSTISNNNIGVLIKPGSQATAYVTIERSRITHSFGAGVRVDGSGAGNINAAVTDTDLSFNSANGLYAVSNGSNVWVGLMRDVFANNDSYGVQANGIHTVVTVGESLFLTNQLGPVNAQSSATLLTHGTNQVTAAQNAAFTGNVGLQ